MKGPKKRTRKAKLTMLGVALLVLLASFSTIAQDKPKKQKSEEFQAVAMGQGTQAGRTFTVNIIINEYSTPEDKQILVEAFTSAGQDGLVNALGKMKAKGRIAITGTLGYDVNYIRQFPAANGRKIRLVTDRPITFGEAWADSRSKEYNLSVLELDLSNEKGKSAGTLLPACKFKIDKNNELQIELLQNAWRLANFTEWK